MDDLSVRKCIACRADTPTLSEELISNYLILLSDWHREGNSIQREFAFKNFKEALEFFITVARIAEYQGHHPDMCIHNWKIVKLTLTTHAAHGLTDNDFIMAAKISRLRNSQS